MVDASVAHVSRVCLQTSGLCSRKSPFHDFQCQMCQAMLKVESAAESTAPLALVAEVEAETVSVGVRIASGYVPKICDSVGFSPVLFGASC